MEEGEAVAEEAVAEEAVAEVVVAEEEGIPPQEDHPWVTQQAEEETIDSSDNPRTYLQEIAPKRRSFSHNGNSTTT